MLHVCEGIPAKAMPKLWVDTVVRFFWVLKVPRRPKEQGLLHRSQENDNWGQAKTPVTSQINGYEPRAYSGLKNPKNAR